jgi:hypothetical protein
LIYQPLNGVSMRLAAIDALFPRHLVMLDAILRGFSRKAPRDLALTPQYAVPPMRRGLNRPEVEPLLIRVMPRSGGVPLQAFGPMRAPSAPRWP